MHAYSCFDCFGFLHYANAYNIVISSMPTDSIANLPVLQNQKIVYDSNSGADCDVLVNDIWYALCTYGVHCVQRYHGLWIYYYTEDRVTIINGTKKTMIVWAMYDWCSNTDGAQPMSSIYDAPEENSYLQ